MYQKAKEIAETGLRLHQYHQIATKRNRRQHKHTTRKQLDQQQLAKRILSLATSNCQVLFSIFIFICIPKQLHPDDARGGLGQQLDYDLEHIIDTLNKQFLVFITLEACLESHERAGMAYNLNGVIQ